MAESRKGEIRRNVIFSTSPDNRAWLEQKAQAENRSLSNYLDTLIQEARQKEMNKENA